MFRTLLVILGFGLALTSGCSQNKPETDQEKASLLIMGPRELDANGDTIFHQIGSFRFFDQDSNLVTEDLVKDKIYVADFFFTTCPSICPKMAQQMIRVHDAFMDSSEVVLLSHSLDPEYDRVPILKDYASALAINTEKWHLLTGSDENIYDFTNSNYMVAAVRDEDAPGGVMHSGAFVLVDRDRHIRGFYDGTQPAEVDRLMEDMKLLLASGE